MKGVAVITYSEARLRAFKMFTHNIEVSRKDERGNMVSLSLMELTGYLYISSNGTHEEVKKYLSLGDL
jgi:hypothetical protein